MVYHNKNKANIIDPTFTGTVTGITKSMVALGSVDNTSDVDKPVSTATQTALDAKADKANTYTQCDVDITISILIASALESLHTLNELAQALANDPNHATTVFAQLATKATTAYVDGQLVLNANQSTTCTKTQVDNALAPKATTA